MIQYINHKKYKNCCNDVGMNTRFRLEGHVDSDKLVGGNGM